MTAPQILLVEDDRGLAELIREEALQRGWDLRHAATGREALAALADFRPCLVILDFTLPDMTAAEILERTDLPPFIVTTGSGDERIAVEMMKKGALDYLVKDAHFLGALPGTVARALHALETERKLREAQARLKAADEELRSAQRLESLGRMAGGIAHDFNNLFQAIQGNLEVAGLMGLGEAQARAAVDRALKVLAKASALAHQMMNVAGKGFRRSEAVDLNRVAMACLSGLPEVAGVALAFVPGGNLPQVEGDPDQLGQVLAGLVANAREAVALTGGTVRVETARLVPGAWRPEEGVWVQAAPPERELVGLTIEDTGAGMTSEVLEKAFDPFFSTHRPGRGLGLSAALGFLKGHGAGLWIRTGPGTGTTVRILFAPAPAAAPPHPAAEDPGASRSLLLVDDDEDLQETLVEFLRDVLGYKVLQARDGLEAIEVYRREGAGIGLILMDATMPRMSGPDAFKAIRELDPSAKAILFSGFSEEAGVKVAREFGFREFLKKPFSLRSLQEDIERVMGEGVSSTASGEKSRPPGGAGP